MRTHCRWSAVSLAVCLTLVLLASLSPAQTDAMLPVPSIPLDGYIPLSGLPSFQTPLVRLRDEGGSSRFLSFSPDGRFLASTNERDEVSEFDLATGNVVWHWAYPELLATSLGTIVWPFCPLAKDAWSNGQWKLTNVPGTPRGSMPHR